MSKTIRFNEDNLIAIKNMLNEIMVDTDSASHNDFCVNEGGLEEVDEYTIGGETNAPAGGRYYHVQDDKVNENIEDEVKSSEVDLSSFKKKNNLVPSIWKDENTLDSKIRLKLLDIADDFWDYVNISWVEPKGIILTGSICNFNWSEFSDIDLHLIVDFDDIDEVFLQVEWEDFETYCKENDIEIDPIRSSSSKFYLNDEHSVITTIRKYADEYSCTYLDMVDALDEILLDVPYYISMNDLRTDEAFNDYLMNTVMDEYDTDGTVEDIQEAVTDICNSEPLIYSIEQEAYCSDYIIKVLKSVVAAYEYVQSFKDNAVDYYKDWIENN